MTFTALLSAIGIAPKTLPQANETLTAAKAQLDSVSALFAAAGLNLEQMLAAGPDSLKAHLASLDNAAELSTLNAQLSTLKEESAEATELIAVLEESVAASGEIFSAIGLSPSDPTDPAAIATAFADHVAKQTTIALAKTGHPPAHVPAAVETPAAAQDPVAIFAEYDQMPIGDARTAFYVKHEAAIWAGKKARDAKK